MKTNMAGTSLGAYEALKKSGKGHTQRGKILQVIIDHPSGLTRRQLAWVTRIELGAVCGRVNSLVADGLVREDGEVECSTTGRPVKLVKPIEDDQFDLFGRMYD